MCACAWRWRDERARRCARWHLPTPAPHAWLRARRARTTVRALPRGPARASGHSFGGCARHPPPPPPRRPAPRRPPPPRPPPPRRRSRSGTGGGGCTALAFGGRGCVASSRVRAAVRPSHARETVVARVTGVKGGGRLGSRQGPDLGPVAARRGVPVPALRGMRRVRGGTYRTPRSWTRSASRCWTCCAEPQGFAAKRRWGTLRRRDGKRTRTRAPRSTRPRSTPSSRRRSPRRSRRGTGTRWSSLSRRVPAPKTA